MTEHPTLRVENIRAVEAKTARIGQGPQLPETLRVTFDEEKELPVAAMDVTDVGMMESIGVFHGGHYLTRWSTSEWPTDLGTEDMEKWLRKNKATVIVPYGMDQVWEQYKGGPWTIECRARQEGSNYVLAEVVKVGSDTEEEAVLGIPSEIFIESMKGSIRWCRAHSNQPETVRADRWVSKEAIWPECEDGRSPRVAPMSGRQWSSTMK